MIEEISKKLIDLGFDRMDTGATKKNNETFKSGITEELKEFGCDDNKINEIIGWINTDFPDIIFTHENVNFELEVFNEVLISIVTTIEDKKALGKDISIAEFYKLFIENDESLENIFNTL